MLKLDLGSGPRNRWYSEDPEWIHLDCEPYEGVIIWECPENIPVGDKMVDEVYIGQLLIELAIEDHLALAREVDRVMKDDGVVKVHCFGGILGFYEFFKLLSDCGWHVEKYELTNRSVERSGTVMETYMIEMKKVPGEM